MECLMPIMMMGALRPAHGVTAQLMAPVAHVVLVPVFNFELFINRKVIPVPSAQKVNRVIFHVQWIVWALLVIGVIAHLPVEWDIKLIHFMSPLWLKMVVMIAIIPMVKL
jgi:hypothetical protein